MAAARTSEGRFNIGWALGISIALHVLLVLIAWLFPGLNLLGTEAVAEEPDETVLNFDFGPVTETDNPSQPLGDVPIPLPETPPPVPAEESPAAPAIDPMEPLEPAESQEEPTESQPPEQSLEEVVDPDEASDTGVRMPEDGAAQVQPPEYTPPQPEPAEPRERELDLDSALRNFKKSVNQAKQPESQSSSSGVYRPEIPQLPSTGFGFGNLEFESRDYDWSDYARQIYLAIWRAWHNRLYQTTDSFERWAHGTGTWTLRHHNRITFTIEGNGHVTGIILESPSGCVPLDDSALDALREVILPPLPSDFPRSRETVHAAFIADGDIRTMKRGLQYLKSTGAF